MRKILNHLAITFFLALETNCLLDSFDCDFLPVSFSANSPAILFNLNLFIVLCVQKGKEKTDHDHSIHKIKLFFQLAKWQFLAYMNKQWPKMFMYFQKSLWDLKLQNLSVIRLITLNLCWSVLYVFQKFCLVVAIDCSSQRLTFSTLISCLGLHFHYIETAFSSNQI